MDSFLNRIDFQHTKNKYILSLGIILVVFISWFGIIDRLSTEYIDGALIQATIAFGTARMLNAIISVLQSTSVDFNFFFAGGSIGIGQMLDPLNDLIEQYSSLMKLSIGSLVIQKVLLHIVSDNLFKILITLSGAALIASIYIQARQAFGWLMKIFVFLVFLRFSLVLVVALNGLVDNYFLVDQTRQDMATLEALPGEVEAMQLEGLTGEELEVSVIDAGALLDEYTTVRLRMQKSLY